MESKNLFIAGCARSGTSALTQLIGSHAEVVMGMERYGHLVDKGNFSLKKEHFEAKRFLNLQIGDTFYDDFQKFHEWDENISEKLKSNTFKYIGDKRPELYLVYDEILQNFPDSKIIFIYRNLFEVAASWNKRAEIAENWPATKDFQKAVYAWNDSMKLTIEAMEKYPNNIVCVRYEDVFVEAADLTPLYKWLELDMDEMTKKKYENILINSERLQVERKSFQLSDDQKIFCEEKGTYRFEKILDDIKLV